MVDVTTQIHSVDRAVATTDVNGTATRVQSLAQSYPSPIDDVWRAVTEPDRIRRWFQPVTGDVRLGSRYQIEGNAGGLVEECVPPAEGSAAHFAITWEFGGGVTWVVVRLTPLNPGSTRLELEHRANVDDVPEAMWQQFGPGATGLGWDSILLGLALYTGGATDGVSPEEAAAWVMSDEGKQFMRLAADAWAVAHQADGASAEIATTAANASYGAYTGEAPDHMA